MARRKPRKARPNERFGSYDSKFEHDLHNSCLKNWEHHTKKIPYTVPHHYHPDFSREIDGKEILVEAKGRFWDSQEYSKYLHARDCLKHNQEIVFIFYKPSLPMPRAKARKDGTKRTHAEWAESNGFRWFTIDTFPKEYR